VNWPDFIGTVGFWTPVTVALIAVIGAFRTARPALEDIGLKRRLETAQRFGELAERASNLGVNKGQSGQIAAIYLLGSFGRDEKHLREAAKATLKDIIQWSSAQIVPPATSSPVLSAATAALQMIP